MTGWVGGRLLSLPGAPPGTGMHKLGSCLHLGKGCWAAFGWCWRAGEPGVGQGFCLLAVVLVLGRVAPISSVGCGAASNSTSCFPGPAGLPWPSH